MFYILYRDCSYNYNYLAENKEETTNKLPLQNGYFLFDTEQTKSTDFYFLSTDIISIKSNMFTIDETLVFKNKIKAQIVYLKLKLEEFRNVHFDIFVPEVFEQYEKKFTEMMEKYPEYVL